MLTRIASAACALCFGLSPVAAQENSTDGFPPPVLTSLLHVGSSRESVSKILKETFEILDANGNGKIEAADGTLLDQVDAISRRGFWYVQIMSSDLDGDGAVTEAELHLHHAFNWRRSRPDEKDREKARNLAWDRLHRSFVLADENKDGKVTMEEAFAWARTTASQVPKQRRPLSTGVYEIVAYANTNIDGITLTDFEAMAQRAFNVIDKDGDGVISPEDYAAVRRDIAQRNRPARSP